MRGVEPEVCRPTPEEGTLGGVIRSQLVNLLPAFGLVPHREGILGLFDLLTAESLAIPLDTPIPPFSRINNDGVPFEFSVSLGGETGEGGLRFLTEVGVPGTSLPSRLNLTCLRLNQVLDHLGLKGAGRELDQAIRLLFPPDPAALKGWRGGMWVAARCLRDGRIGLRVYADASGGEEPERWGRLGRLLAHLGNKEGLNALRELAPILTPGAYPLGIALDAVPRGVGRIKLYLRTRPRPSLDFVRSALDAAGHGTDLPLFLSWLYALRPADPAAPLPGLVVSLELPEGPGKGVDIKVDACAHCLFKDDREAGDACQRAALRWSVDLGPYHAVLEELAGKAPDGSRLVHHAFVGAGFAHGKAPRLDIYLKPSHPLHAVPPCGPREGSDPSILLVTPPPPFGEERLEEAAAEAARFLVERQSAGGQWIDFELPPGPSDGWVTAFVGLSLAELPLPLRSGGTEAAVERACRWCLEAMNPDGGWGFNSRTGSDADSTAHALLLLAAAGRPVPRGSLAALLAFQREDGGFSTYLPDESRGSWGVSHADVTPVALGALLAHGVAPVDPALAAGGRFLEKRQGENGMWPSFWWDSHLYATWANLKLFRRLGWPYQPLDLRGYQSSLPPVSGAFSLGLLLACARMERRLAYREEDPALPGRLLATQCADGGFRSRPMLRLTRKDCAEPWRRVDSGRFYADSRRLLTTATVLRCLTPPSPGEGGDPAPGGDEALPRRRG